MTPYKFINFLVMDSQLERLPARLARPSPSAYAWERDRQQRWRAGSSNQMIEYFQLKIEYLRYASNFKIIGSEWLSEETSTNRQLSIFNTQNLLFVGAASSRENDSFNK